MDRLLRIIIFLFCANFAFAQSIKPRQIENAPTQGYVLYSRNTVEGGQPQTGRYYHVLADSIFQDRALDLVYFQNDSLYFVVANSVTGAEDTFSVHLPYMDSTDISATMPITYNPLTGNISTSVNDGHIIGRYTPGGAGVVQEIDIGYGLDLTTTGVLRADTNELATVTALIDSIANIPAQNITLSGDVTGSGTTSITTTIANNAVTNSKFRQGVGASVVGVTGASTANVADIVSTSNTALRNVGGILSFGQITGSIIAITGNRVLHGSGAGTATDDADFTYFNDDLYVSAGFITSSEGYKVNNAAPSGQYLRGNGTTFVSSALTASDLAANSITDGLIRQSAGLSVLGRSANSTGNIADITAGTDGHVLRRSGTTLGFGLLPLSSVSATNGQLVYAAGGVQTQSANLTYSGTTLQNIGGGIIVGNLTGSTAAGNGILIQRGSLNAGMYSNGTTATFGSVTAHPVSFVSSNTAALTIGIDQSVMIGTATPDNRILLNLFSASKVIFFPRLTTAAIGSIGSPSIGMFAVDTDLSKMRFHDGTLWRSVALEGVGYARNINTQTVAYQPVLTDLSKVVTISNASPVNFTVPLNSTTAFPIGSQIDIIQLGAGQVTVVGAGGVTVNSANGLKLRAQYSSATLIKIATDTWVLVGDTDI